MKSVLAKHDPRLDLVMEREVDVPVSLVWKVWTTPEHLKQWFCPRPWSVTHCEIDLRPERVNSAIAEINDNGAKIRINQDSGKSGTSPASCEFKNLVIGVRNRRFRSSPKIDTSV
jgi:hypothetical protein